VWMLTKRGLDIVVIADGLEYRVLVKWVLVW
jgi:hypothetical protein